MQQACPSFEASVEDGGGGLMVRDPQNGLQLQALLHYHLRHLTITCTTETAVETEIVTRALRRFRPHSSVPHDRRSVEEVAYVWMAASV